MPYTDVTQGGYAQVNIGRFRLGIQLPGSLTSPGNTMWSDWADGQLAVETLAGLAAEVNLCRRYIMYIVKKAAFSIFETQWSQNGLRSTSAKNFLKEKINNVGING